MFHILQIHTIACLLLYVWIKNCGSNTFVCGDTHLRIKILPCFSKYNIIGRQKLQSGLPISCFRNWHIPAHIILAGYKSPVLFLAFIIKWHKHVLKEKELMHFRSFARSTGGWPICLALFLAQAYLSKVEKLQLFFFSIFGVMLFIASFISFM